MNIRMITHNQLLEIKKLIDWAQANGKRVALYVRHEIDIMIEENKIIFELTGEYPLVNFNMMNGIEPLMPETDAEKESFKEFKINC